MKDDELREQINALIRTEIQDVINDYVMKPRTKYSAWNNLVLDLLNLKMTKN